MAKRIDADTWEIQGETVTLPVTIKDARITVAMFTARAEDARRVLGGTPLRPLAVAGRAVTVLMLIHYPEWALKSYDEVAVGLLTRGGLHIVDLPVTGAFTREAGEDLWALPKWLMGADLEFAADRTSVAVRDGATEVMRAVVRAGRLRLPFGVRAWMPVRSYLERGAQANRLLRGRVPLRLSGIRLGRSGCEMRLGDHPMAERMRALGMLGRPFLTITAQRWGGPLGSYVETG
ncbi:acetoacetate decarboxylase family protein [Actinoplanes sp. NBRC 103695]|uniref:acetoacetate decarboxylase family protein n=1 Tax=Actinoplanes sp. NBRC 103695 TaxID=3032202 RepID=UPI0024A5A809|nr:acetoacetate decarboxylase family protein [Actinoplanes sp. NBRC 103695]GLY99912.1 hypothetical protein Acsp02_71650 [Actinoplanes sp. NBRC 103695]